MKRSQVFPSNYLGKDDLDAGPAAGDITDVRLESLKNDTGTEDKPVLHFAPGTLKPLIVNQTNWMILEDAYGPDSDEWRGRPVEVYVDPGVMFGGRRVGGVRVRIPAARPLDPSGAGNGSPINRNRTRTPTPADPARSAPQKPDPALAPKPAAPPTLADKHAQIVAGFAGASTAAYLDEWARWAKGFEFTPEQDDDQADAYHAAQERIALAAGPAAPRRPVTA